MSEYITRERALEILNDIGGNPKAIQQAGTRR